MDNILSEFLPGDIIDKIKEFLSVKIKGTDIYVTYYMNEVLQDLANAVKKIESYTYWYKPLSKYYSNLDCFHKKYHYNHGQLLKLRDFIELTDKLIINKYKIKIMEAKRA